jgi:sugar/nucleoside kinase (ribokinase family)
MVSVTQRYHVLGFGNPFYDRAVAVPDDFLPIVNLKKGLDTFTTDRKEVEKSWNQLGLAEMKQITLGGSGVNVIKVLAHLGNNCALCGKVGRDGAGIISELNKIGITTLLSSGTKETGVVNCFVTPDKQRTMQTYLGSAEEFSENDVQENYFRDVKHVHHEGYSVLFGDTLKKSIAFANAQGATTSIDLSSVGIVEAFKPKFEASLSKINYVFGNVQELQAFTGMKSMEEMAKNKFDKRQILVITDGERGCWVKFKDSHEVIHYPANQVTDVLDTIGAGDYFAGGFLHGILKEKEAQVCVDMGKAAASAVICTIGAELPTAEWTKLKRRIKELEK